MKKYRILVLPPKVKRMQGSGLVVINIEDGWNGWHEKTFSVGDSPYFEFEMPNDIPWIHNNSVIDGKCFSIKLIYTNKDKTRQEILRPVPEELLNN